MKNADAHGKNYSFMHGADGHVTLSPLYDAVPMGFFPEYGQGFSMPVGNEEQIMRISAAHWRALAAETGLDEDKVTRIVSDVAEGILEHVDETFGELDVPHQKSATAEIKRYNERIRRELPSP